MDSPGLNLQYQPGNDENDDCTESQYDDDDNEDDGDDDYDVDDDDGQDTDFDISGMVECQLQKDREEGVGYN